MLHPNRRFGLLAYSTYNLGDQIQSLAARRFLPRVDHYIDREALDEYQPAKAERLKLIMNGWYCHRADKWPPSPHIDPLLVSIHISDHVGEGSGLRAREAFAKSPKVREFLQRHGPVGARDCSTLALLQSWGVDSYFSGCMTLTLERPPVARASDLVVLCDVPDTVADYVATATASSIRRTAHRDEIMDGIEARFARARALLELYATATCVVTTRLHCALPCLAMGTPVLLLDTAPDRYRFSGLIDLVRHCSVDEFLSGVSAFDLATPPANPLTHLPLRRALTDRARRFANESMLARVFQTVRRG